MPDGLHVSYVGTTTDDKPIQVLLHSYRARLTLDEAEHLHQQLGARLTEARCVNSTAKPWSTVTPLHGPRR